MTDSSFLRGGSHPEEYVEQAFDHGYEAIGTPDRNSLAGAVRASMLAKHNDMRAIVGARLDLRTGEPSRLSDRRPI
jgi:error-prone DNA polymerase